jgi:hypothetical protein
VILLEGDEESGSADLPFYLELYAQKIGTPNIIVNLKIMKKIIIFNKI